MFFLSYLNIYYKQIKLHSLHLKRNFYMAIGQLIILINSIDKMPGPVPTRDQLLLVYCFFIMVDSTFKNLHSPHKLFSAHTELYNIYKACLFQLGCSFNMGGGGGDFPIQKWFCRFLLRNLEGPWLVVSFAKTSTVDVYYKPRKLFFFRFLTKLDTVLKTKVLANKCLK